MWPFENLDKRAAQRAEERATVKQSDPNFLRVIFGEAYDNIVVTRDTILKTPPGWGAVNFLAGTLAGLPLELYRKGRNGRETVNGPLANMLHYAVNDETSSFDWRFRFFCDVFTTGRGLTYIERGPSGTPINLFNLDPRRVTVKMTRGRKTYEYRDYDERTLVYPAADIIDVPFMLDQDGVGAIGPVVAGKDAFRLALAVMEYSNKFLANGGVPPFAVTGNFQTSQALKRAADDLQQAVKKAAKEERQALILPTGLEIKPIGSDPDKTQMIETQRWCVEQIARLYGLPPTFLQDLTHGTFSNTEQQDLHFVKHTLRRWVEQFEQEMNLKLFGRASNSRYVEMNVDGLLRGDFASRTAGYATGITHGFLKPSEVRMLENWPEAAGADQLFIQSGTVPITQAETPPPDPVQQPDEIPPEGDTNGN